MRYSEIRKRVKAYMKYHHENTHPAKESHSKFMTCVSYLEAWEDEFEGDEGWKAMRLAINRLYPDELKTLYKLTKD